MTPLNLRPPTLDEIVFEGRNQAYGAYQLRQLYNRHMRRALLIAISLFALLVMLPIIAQLYFVDEHALTLPKPAVDKETRPIDVNLPKPPKLATPAAAPAPAPAAKSTVKIPAVTPPRIVPNDQIIERPVEPVTPVTTPVVEQGEGVPGGLGAANTNKPGDGIGDTPGEGDTKGDTNTNTGKSDIFISVEKMPEFTGGQEAMMKYLRRNLHYPAAAIRERVAGKVFVAFTINATGDIVDVEVIKGLGFGTDDEAKRVIQQMPRWQAGRQNGRAVAVRYTLPITFNLGD